MTIPDGLASAVLAGLNPVHGLFALMVAMPLAALIVLTFLVGAIQLALGLLKLGAIARFVSNMVMIAWLYPRSVSRAPAPRAAIKPPKKFWA